MARDVDLALYRQIQAGLSRRAQASLRRLIRGLSLTDKRALYAALMDGSVPVIQALSEVSGVAGADYYNANRARNRGLAAFDAVDPGPAPAEQITKSVSWALAQPDPVGNLGKVADRIVKSRGRIAIEQSLAADPARPRFARVPQGAMTCQFCAMLASRGAVYESEQSAGAGGHEYHDHCDCEAVPVFGTDLPDGFDPDHYYEIYMSLSGPGIDLDGSRAPSVGVV